jgi:type IV pilus assembly protein PilO
MAKSLEEYPRRVQAGVLVGIAVLLGAVASWYLVWPRAQQCFAEGKAIQAQHAQNVAHRAFELQLPLYQKRLKEAQGRLDDLRSKVPDDVDPAGLVRLVHDAESASGVHVRALAMQPQVNSNVYIELPAKLHVDGEYDALVSFFDHLGESARITNVSDLALSLPTTAGAGAFTLAPQETVAADFVLSTYCNGTGTPPPAAVKK